MSRGADPLIRDGYSRTALLAAAKSNHVMLVKYLVSARATTSSDAQSRDKELALLLASSDNRVEIVKVLVEAGVNPMVPMVASYVDGTETPLQIAQSIGHHRCIELLQVRVTMSRG